MVSELWHRAWYQDARPATLAGMRVVIASQALWMLLSRDPAGVAALPPVVWRGEDPMFRWRFLLVPGVTGIEHVIWICGVVSLCCVLVGYRSRIFGVIAALILYHVAPLQSLLTTESPWSRGFTIAMLALPILACSPSEDCWSVESVFRRVPGRPPGAYGWAITLVRLLFAQIYLFSGLAKLRTAGLGWVSVQTVRNHLLLFGLLDLPASPSLSGWIAARPALCFMLAAGTLTFELVFVAAVFVRSVRLPLVVAAVLFHAGLWATLGFRFLNFPHLLLFVDFARSPPEGPAGE